MPTSIAVPNGYTTPPASPGRSNRTTNHEGLPHDTRGMGDAYHVNLYESKITIEEKYKIDNVQDIDIYHLLLAVENPPRRDTLEKQIWKQTAYLKEINQRIRDMRVQLRERYLISESLILVLKKLVEKLPASYDDQPSVQIVAMNLLKMLQESKKLILKGASYNAIIEQCVDSLNGAKSRVSIYDGIKLSHFISKTISDKLRPLRHEGAPCRVARISLMPNPYPNRTSTVGRNTRPMVYGSPCMERTLEFYEQE